MQTTIDSNVQGAALTALDNQPYSGEIVAVQASTGHVLAVAQHQGATVMPGNGPLDSRLQPGNAFTIVSAAALLAGGLKVNTPISCENSFTVGGQTFTSYGSGALKPFSADFADGCGTAFAGLSERLTTSQFNQFVRAFGIGLDWTGLPVPAFSGSVPSAANDADLANQTIGKGNVQVSPLVMAMVAAEVDSGSWHAPVFTMNPANPPRGPATSLAPQALAQLRGLMRSTVSSGAGRAANVHGMPVYGQVGLIKSGSVWLSWFVGFRGDIAFTAIESGSSPQMSAAALAGAFMSAVGNQIPFALGG